MRDTKSRRIHISAAFLLLALPILCLSAQQAFAVDVFFNGVRVSGLKNQSFKNCTVRFDASGNVHIAAQGYSVKRVDQSTTTAPRANRPTKYSPPPSTRVTSQYFLYARAPRPGYSQYDVDVYLNGKWIRKVRNGEKQAVLEVTKYLKPGKNVVHFAATKNFGGKPRRSFSAADHIEVFIGEGNRGGGTVNITTTLADFKASADRTDNFGRETTIQIK